MFEWLKRTIETHPITFVIAGEILVYFLALVLAVLLLATVRHTGIVIAPFLSGFLAVGFHWFVTRYERKSKLAQILAIVPAGFFCVSLHLKWVWNYGKSHLLEASRDWADRVQGALIQTVRFLDRQLIQLILC